MTTDIDFFKNPDPFNVVNNMAKQMSVLMPMQDQQVCDQPDLVQFSVFGVSPSNRVQHQ